MKCLPDKSINLFLSEYLRELINRHTVSRTKSPAFSEWPIMENMMVAKWMSMKMPQDQLWMERIDFLPNQTVFFIEISLKGTTAQKDKNSCSRCVSLKRVIVYF